MPEKTIHINRDAIDAVETYYDEDGEVISRAIHLQGNERKFSSAEGQYCDPTITDGMVILRGQPLDGDNQ